MRIFDALVIGGGPAGAATALRLAQGGWSVALVEKKTFPRRKVCGEFISATSLPIMKSLGILETYLEQAGPEIKRVAMFAHNAIIISDMPVEKKSAHKWGRAFGREHLDSILVNEAVRAGVVLWQPWTASDIVDHQTHVTATLSAKDKSMELSARVLILANGSWERGVIPEITQAHKPTDLLGFKAHFHNASLDDDLMPLLSFPGGYGGMVHTDNGRITLSCCVRRDKLDEIRKNNPKLAAGEAVVQHIRSTCRGADAVLSTAVRDGAWLAAGPLRPGIRSCYANGVFYVGNIAGEAHPVIAEGISIAMQSGWILAETLLAQGNHSLTRDNLDLVGRHYSKQWHRQFAPRIHAARCIAQLSMRPWAMTMMLPILKKYPGLLSFGARLSGKITRVLTQSDRKR